MRRWFSFVDPRTRASDAGRSNVPCKDYVAGLDWVEGEVEETTMISSRQSSAGPRNKGGAQNIRDMDPHALSPTSTVFPPTRDANQVIPSDAPAYPER